MNAKQPNPLPTRQDLERASQGRKWKSRRGLPLSYDERDMNNEGGYNNPPPKPKPEPPKYPPKS